MTKNQLANALFSKSLSGGGISLNGIYFTEIINVEREDGSGSSFNVTGYEFGCIKKTVHVRTID
jgi:hypothetical protein